MKIEVIVAVSCEEFFDILMESLRHDIKAATGDAIDVEALKSGYTYDKKLANKFGHENSSKTTLTKIDYPNCYEIKFSTHRGDNWLRYELQDLNNGTTKIIYEESYDASTKSQAANHNMMKYFYKWSAKKRIIKMINQIEEHIKTQRK